MIYSFWKKLLPAGVDVKARFDVDDRFLHKFGATFKTHRSTAGGLGNRVFAYAYQTVGNDSFQSIWLYGFYDVVYAGAFVSPSYYFAMARRNVRIDKARKQRRSHQRRDFGDHPAVRRRRRK
jgi:hypothetical protein